METYTLGELIEKGLALLGWGNLPFKEGTRNRC